MVLQSALSADELEGLHAECERRLTTLVAAMDAVGAQTLGLSHRDSRYFLHAPLEDSPFMQAFVFDGPLVDVAASLIGPEVLFFLDLFVVKPAEVGLAMAWHQDGGYVMGHPHDPYVSLWVALDDMTAENGALWVLPRGRHHDPGDAGDVGEWSPAHHAKDPSTNDLVGYAGPDPGELLEVPAGSIVAMSSTTFHRTGENRSSRVRRAFLASYSPTPITASDGTLWNRADRCRPRHSPPT